MRFLLVGFALLVLMSSTALANNADTTLPLHALATTYGPCPIPPPSGPDPCTQGTLLVDVPMGGGIAVYLLARNYDDCAAVQTAFDWPPAWPFTFGLWTCQSNQVSGTTPTAPGPTTGTISTAFDCLSGGVTAPIGTMHFAAVTAPGCMSQINSSYPFETHIVDCTGGTHEINVLNRGAICAATPGSVNACDSVIPVEPATWGDIKNQYR